MIFGIWDSSTTAILTGITVGILGSVASAGAALYSRFSAAGIRSEQLRLNETVLWYRTQLDSLSDRIWQIEKCLRECEKRESKCQAQYESLQALYQELKSLLPKSGHE